MNKRELTEIRERAERATAGPWNHELERYSAKNVIGVKPIDDRWVAHCQPEFNGHDNAEFVAHSRTDIPRLCEFVERLADSLRECAGYLHSDYEGRGGKDLTDGTWTRAEQLLTEWEGNDE